MRAEARSGLLMSTPYAAFLLLFAIFPIAFSAVLVLLKWDLVTAPSFAGLDNVQHLIGDARFWRAVANTLVFLAIHLPLQIVVALTLAWVLDRPLFLRSFWRAAFFLPVVISGAAVTILWSALYATDVGLINGLLARIDLGPVPWLTDPAIAMPSIAVMATWKNVGFYVVIYLAGLQGVPRSCQEAIELEGATTWQSFRHVTLPLLKPQTLLVVTLSTIGGFQLFIEPYILTGGGPLRRTLSVVLYMYRNAFSYQKMGYAATLGVALALLIATVLVIQRRLIGRAEEA
ncbi:MAG: sugar ABC transporter permease [Gemmatimonadales bacterium]